ncbi:MAG: hypothetical protein OEQ12_07150 [Nitrosopumilus sp.]|nr:hypothetical protein [Nitrosopumilus sp.]
MSEENSSNVEKRRKSTIKELNLWIGILFLLLIILNIILFSIYKTSDDSGNSTVTQIWEYMESKPFQGVTASLVTPIIFFFLENRLKFLSTIHENSERQREIKEAERKEKDKHVFDLTQRHLIQFEEILSSVWFRFHNFLYEDALEETLRREQKDGYLTYSTLYALGCLLAYQRLFLIEGIYAEMDRCSKDLDKTIKNELITISKLLDELGKKLNSSFYRYDQLALAEGIMIKDDGKYKISSQYEFRQKLADPDSLQYSLLYPSMAFVKALNEDSADYREYNLRIMEHLGNIIEGLKQIPNFRVAVKDENLKKVKNELSTLEK